MKKCDFGAVQRSALCRSRRELSNAYFLAKFGLDTAENEPCQVCPTPRNAAASCAPPAARLDWANFRGLVLGCIEAKFCKKICVGKLSPRSTQCTPLHRSAISIFCQEFAKNFAKFKILQIISGNFTITKNRNFLTKF